MKRNQKNAELFKHSLKCCSQCNQIKPLSKFNKNSKHVDGYASICKECNKNYHKEWRAKNRESHKIVLSKRCSTCKQIKSIDNFHKKKCAIDGYCEECKECANIKHGEWRKKNREKIRESDKKTYQRIKEKRKIYYKKWKDENPEIRRSNNRNRKAIKKGAIGRHSNDDILRLYEAQQGKCLMCGKKTKLTVDHIVPLSRGGSNSLDNLQLLCSSCNSSKYTKIKDLRSKGILSKIFKQGDLFDDFK